MDWDKYREVPEAIPKSMAEVKRLTNIQGESILVYLYAAMIIWK